MRTQSMAMGQGQVTAGGRPTTMRARVRQPGPPGPLQRAAYALGQTARVGWYMAQLRLAARLAGPAIDRDRRPPDLKTPSADTLMAELRQLFRQDFDAIAAGHYRMPHDLVLPPLETLDTTLRFFRDLPSVVRRRRAGVNSEPFRTPPAGTPKLPRYYLQNFHYQTDGWLSDRSARVYDHQVEVLFSGGADAMRRAALVPLFHHLSARRVGACRMLDVAAGTGRFLTFVKDNWPRLHVTALDLSEPYLRHARRSVRRWGRLPAVQAPAEAMPIADASQDIVTCIYLFHELPRKVRAQVAAEMARVLKPDGILILVDSLQKGDRPHLDGLLDLFPLGYHEPYFADYTVQDLQEPFAAAGLALRETRFAFLSKVMVFARA